MSSTRVFFSSPEACTRTGSITTFDFAVRSVALAIAVVNRSGVAEIPQTIGTGRLVPLPLMIFCTIVWRSSASSRRTAFIPSCASSRIT